MLNKRVVECFKVGTTSRVYLLFIVISKGVLLYKACAWFSWLRACMSLTFTLGPPPPSLCLLQGPGPQAVSQAPGWVWPGDWEARRSQTVSPPHHSNPSLGPWAPEAHSPSLSHQPKGASTILSLLISGDLDVPHLANALQ